MDNNIQNSIKSIRDHIKFLKENNSTTEIAEIEKEINIIKNLISSTNKTYLFIIEDKYLESIWINDKILMLINEFKLYFWDLIFDEVAILKIIDNKLVPSFYFNKNNLFSEDVNEINSYIIKNAKDFKFWEINSWWWIILDEQEWESFDIAIRVWEYFLLFNNSENSISELMEKHWLKKNIIITKITKFYETVFK